jgi:hypothetical protein
MPGVLKAKVDGVWVPVTGVGAGVEPGGATGQILAKASAADYDTAWTSAPVLTGLTSSGDVLITGGNVLLNNGISLMGRNSSGTPEISVLLANDNILYVGPNFTGGRSIRIGNGAATTITGDATITGTLTSKNVLAAFAHINQTGADNGGFGFSSVSRFGTGSYRMITDRWYTYLWAMAAPWWINNTNVEAHSTNGNTIEIFSYSSSAHTLQDGHVTVIAVGIL